MGVKKLFGRIILRKSRPIHQDNAGAQPVSHPLQNSGSNHIQDQDQVPPIFDGLRPPALQFDSGNDVINNDVLPYSSSNSGVGGASRSGSSSSGSSRPTMVRRSKRGFPRDVIADDAGVIPRVSGVIPIPPLVSDTRSVDVIVQVPNIIEDERQRLVREYTRAKKYWWWGFAVDGTALTCLENCMELGSKSLNFLILLLLYIGFFPFWVKIVMDRQIVMERTPVILEVSAGFVKMAYLICLRCLYFWGITSSKNMVAYFLFRCIGSVTIKYLSSLSSLKVLEQKFKLAIANLAAPPSPPSPPAPPAVPPNLSHVD